MKHIRTPLPEAKGDQRTVTLGQVLQSYGDRTVYFVIVSSETVRPILGRPFDLITPSYDPNNQGKHSMVFYI